MDVCDLREGECAVVTAVAAGEEAAARLRLLNVSEGAKIRLVRRAPFGGGFLLEAGGVRLSVSRSLAGRIYVREEKDG